MVNDDDVIKVREFVVVVVVCRILEDDAWYGVVFYWRKGLRIAPLSPVQTRWKA